MKYISILFKNKIEKLQNLPEVIPQHFTDLNLDQIVDEITSGWHEYNLKPFFYFPLNETVDIQYRQNVFKDLEDDKIYEAVKKFTESMRTLRKYLSQIEKFYYAEQKEIWFLYAAEIYCDAIKYFRETLSSFEIKSDGFNKIKNYIIEYSSGKSHISLVEEIKNIKAKLAAVKYQIIIKDTSFTVQYYEEGIDYSEEIERTFSKFRTGDVKDYKIKYNSALDEMNHIEAKIIEFVSQLYPEVFLQLKDFNSKYSGFIDETISTYDREIQFYISYMEHIKKFKRIGLKFCYPLVVNNSKEIFNYEGFDLALAQKLFNENLQTVCNDFYLKDNERTIVISGPNQGGKTTFARAFGQLHYLSSIGCPVPGSKAQLFLADNIFTQFERVEKVENLRGKLEDDLKRIDLILKNATSKSIIIMNEVFNSTTLEDMTFLSKKILEKILKLDAICIWVTFADELANFNDKTVSMTSMIVPENPALRTFKIVRRNADGLAYAMAIAEKYRLRYNTIKERIGK
jgi:DNA mismatch repair protein MutS